MKAAQFFFAPFLIALSISFLAQCGKNTGEATSGQTAAATPTFTILYAGNGNTGGTVPVDSNNYPAGASFTVLGNTGTLVKTGFVFAGWNTLANGTGTAYSAGSTYSMGSANVTLYAAWTPAYNVTYNGNGSTSGSLPVDSNNYVAGSSVTILANTGNLINNSIVFGGWNSAADGSGTDYLPGASLVMGSTNLVLYAKWTPNYTITYNGNGNTGGTAPTDSFSYAAGANATVLSNTGNLSKVNFTFIGWNTASNGLGTFYPPGTTCAIASANVNLYAIYLGNFTAHNPPQANIWRSVAYGNGVFVAVAQNGTNQVMTSSDGITWSPQNASEATSWMIVTYAASKFVAIAFGGINPAMISADGIAWAGHSISESNAWRSVTYGNGVFVAVAGNGTNRVMTSPDGLIWTARQAIAANDWQSVTFGNGLFAAVSGDGSNQIMTSPDGIFWTARNAPEANQWLSVTFGNNVFVAVANTGTNRVMTSSDGTNWIGRTASEANQWRSVVYGNGLFVAVATDGVNQVMTSPNGINWMAKAAPEPNSWVSLTYGQGLFVAVSLNGTNRVMRAVWF
ncbi:InlB B-repeat-containing protein [Turneriella parva]|uniref:Cell wall/surface repeat protein n=1 Tax=Turneriella parva (strain ATCC BAA-1111 / DSM 21527 / NCTC 11395 / H) TaxID=869212 RepID=I4B6W9_TURPD|nr:InlB B-repeat-containing protein [Turneriella parva]AFM13026.1 cell wall/surface repeat protein [Turneriella parva DSM 21527]